MKRKISSKALKDPENCKIPPKCHAKVKYHWNVQTLTGSSIPLDFIDRNRIFMFAANTTEQDDNCTLVRKSNQTYPHLPTACTAKSLQPYDTSCFDTTTPLPPASLVPVHTAPATHRPLAQSTLPPPAWSVTPPDAIGFPAGMRWRPTVPGAQAAACSSGAMVFRGIFCLSWHRW